MIYYDNIEFKNNKSYEVYLLKKYLTRAYGEAKAIALIKARANNLDSLAVALGRNSIEFFNLYFLSDTFVVKDNNTNRSLAPEHYNLWNIAERIFIKDEIDKACIIEPRGLAKTTTFNMALSIWLHCYKLSKFTLIGAKTDNDASQFLDSIKRIFTENKKIIDNFGNQYDRKNFTINANEFELKNNTYIRVVGSGTSVRGANWGGIRPTVVIVDDYQSESDIVTEDARTKKYDKFIKEVEQVGDKAVYRDGVKIKSETKIIAIGTVLHIDCLMSKLSRNNNYYTTIRQAIVLEEGQDVEDILEAPLWRKCRSLYFNNKDENRKETAYKFYLDNIEEMRFKTLWSEKWDCFKDLAVIYWENRKAFMSELMNDATSIGEKWFKGVRTAPREEIEANRFTKTLLSVDCASTTGAKSDYTSIIVGSKDSGDFSYIRDIILKKLAFEDYCRLVVDKLEEYPEIVYINIEKNTYSGADVLRIKELIQDRPTLRGRRFIFINDMQRKNKDEKISTIIDRVNNGQIILNSECEDTQLAINQLLDFQGQKYSLHDDFPDNLAEFEIKIKDIKTKTVLRVGSIADLYKRR